ncbi:MAG: ammonia-forming cytochrome c nitrite reductase subunit c552 [Desulfuromonadales bacterium]|nr:MAG: ammonia-forming cytochrome c nitrite reductase subunit c552 [Desulfuromonadales bacterium]
MKGERWGRAIIGAVVAALLVSFCPSRDGEAKTVRIPEGEIDPIVWGKAYPTEYEMWKMTDQPEPPGKSKYKRGFDADRITLDKLSEFPFLALLLNGWGMGVEYNEPTGHANMLRDQLEVDASRVKAGGVCLTCKTPYAPKLQKEMGGEYYRKPFREVLAGIPEQHRTLGVACIDCHDTRDLSLRISREFTLGSALRDMGVDRSTLTRQEMRSLVCAQCHVTYSIPKDREMKSEGLFFPWQGSRWGKITIENIIGRIRSDPAHGEWTQSVTGFRMGFIRHPEFEFFSNNGLHWRARAACSDCHMPFVMVGDRKISDHRIMSPLKNDLKACERCHIGSREWLRKQVFAVQDRTISGFIRAGYATATVAKLFELTHRKQAAGKRIDKTLYDQAKDHYLEAFYRVVFMGAENSVGFHNPTEAMRILGDAASHAARAEALLRQGLAGAGVTVPKKVDLQLEKYLNKRGSKKLMFKPELRVKDPLPVK